MSVDLQEEHLYEQVYLVRGAGSRLRGELCIMSLVAYLADERHTDRPQTASSFVRNFAIQLNDGAPATLRQDLKPFAPRIIGTNDGHDLQRASLAYQVITEEVWPRAERDAVILPEDVAHETCIKGLWSFAASLRRRSARLGIAARFQALRAAHDKGDCLTIGTLAGQLLVGLVQRAPTHQRWYWAKALELLDRLCDVGCDERASTMGFSSRSGSLGRNRSLAH
jgi:hypothetical protein